MQCDLLSVRLFKLVNENWYSLVNWNRAKFCSMVSYVEDVIAMSPIASAFNWEMPLVIALTHRSKVPGLSFRRGAVRLRKTSQKWT